MTHLCYSSQQLSVAHGQAQIDALAKVAVFSYYEAVNATATKGPLLGARASVLAGGNQLASSVILNVVLF